MKTPDQEQPTEMPEACATTPMGRAIRLIGDAWILQSVTNSVMGSATLFFPTVEAPHVKG